MTTLKYILLGIIKDFHHLSLFLGQNCTCSTCSDLFRTCEKCTFSLVSTSIKSKKMLEPVKSCENVFSTTTKQVKSDKKCKRDVQLNDSCQGGKTHGSTYTSENAKKHVLSTYKQPFHRLRRLFWSYFRKRRQNLAPIGKQSQNLGVVPCAIFDKIKLKSHFLWRFHRFRTGWNRLEQVFLGTFGPENSTLSLKFHRKYTPLSISISYGDFFINKNTSIAHGNSLSTSRTRETWDLPGKVTDLGPLSLYEATTVLYMLGDTQ